MERLRERWIRESQIHSSHINEIKNSCKEFFHFVHGHKPDIRKFLEGPLNLTGKYQIIYEIMQNSDDAGAECLLVYYDENYLLFANNGKPFDYEDVKSICNIGQTTKGKCDKIGRFGIGFKLAYLLLGGVDGVVKEYKAPIIFSWCDKDQIRALIESNGDVKSSGDDHPLLFKPILTAIPTGVGECLIDLNNEERELFSKDEVKKLIEFINKNSNLKNQLLNFNRGSIFFFEITSEDSKEFEKFLNEQKGYIKASLSFLRHLKTIIINDYKYEKPKGIKIKDFTIRKNSGEWSRLEKFLTDEQKECDFQIKIAYIYSSVELKEYPTLYKFLPIPDEKHKLNFIIHSDFKIEESRRRIQEDEFNRQILTLLKEKIIEYLENNKNNEKEFRELYYAILTSDLDKSSSFIKNDLCNALLDYIRQNIPIRDQNSRFNIVKKDREKVIVKGTSLEITPQDFGIDKYWFYYEDEYAKSSAKDSKKLNLEEWGLKELIENGVSKKINNWIANNLHQYNNFIRELNELKIKDLKRIENKLRSEIKWLKFDDELLSINDVASKHNYIIYNSMFLDHNIKQYLKKLGAKFTDIDFKDYMNIFDKFFNEYDFIYRKIINFINSMTDDILNRLTFEERRELFRFLKDRLKNVVRVKENRSSKNVTYYTYRCPKCGASGHHISVPRRCRNEQCRFEFNRIKDLRDLKLFKSKNGRFTSLKKLLKPSDTNPRWLKDYEMVEYFDDEDLDNLLCKGFEVFQNIIVGGKEEEGEIEEIVKKIDDLSNFYKELDAYYRKFKEHNKQQVGELVDRLKNKKFIKDIHGELSRPSEIVLPFGNEELKEYLLTTKNYEIINNIIEQIYSKRLPQKNLIDVLTELSLYKLLIQDLKISEKDLTNKEFSDSDLVELLKILYFENVNIFSRGYCLESKDDKFKFSSYEKEKVVYYTTDRKLKNILNKYRKYFIEFPLKSLDLDNLGVSTEDFLEKLGVIVSRDSILRKLLSIDLNDDDLKDPNLSSIMRDTDRKLKEQYVAKVLSIKNLPDLEGIETNGFLRDLLLIAKDIDWLEKLRDKLTYHSDKLSNYVLSRSSIEEYEDLDIDIKVIPDSIIKKLRGIGLNEKDLRKLFKGEITNDQIYRLLRKKLNGKLIEKSSQLAFILKYAKEQKDLRYINNFKVKTKGGEFWLNEQILPLYLTDLPFIDEKHILDTEFYEGIDGKLGLDPSKLVFKVEDNPVILVKPYFDDSTFYCPWIRDDLDKEENIHLRKELINFIYNEWRLKEGGTKKRVINIDSGDKKSEEDITVKILGFDPKICVYPDKYACKHEKLPEWIKNWIAEKPEEIKRKQIFLSQLGVNTENSLVVRLRKFLIGEIDDDVDIKDIDTELLLNTLIFLSEQEREIRWERSKKIYNIYEVLGKKLINHLSERIFIAYKENEKGIRIYKFKSLEKDIVFLRDHDLFYDKFKNKDKIWFVDSTIYPKEVLKLLIEYSKG